MAKDLTTTGNELFFDDDELIVSKTDLKGRVTYCNDVFLRLAGYSEREMLGQPHSIIRHPDMPRCVFQLLWSTIEGGDEIFAYVVNRAKNGDHYWVNAHVTPSFSEAGEIIGYHSNRRTPDRAVLEETIKPLYRKILDVENAQSDRKAGMHAGHAYLVEQLSECGLDYDEFIATL